MVVVETSLCERNIFLWLYPTSVSLVPAGTLVDEFSPSWAVMHFALAFLLGSSPSKLLPEMAS